MNHRLEATLAVQEFSEMMYMAKNKDGALATIAMKDCIIFPGLNTMQLCCVAEHFGIVYGIAKEILGCSAADLVIIARECNKLTRV